MGTALCVASVGDAVGVTTSLGRLPPAVFGDGAAMNAEAANTNAVPVRATATTVTIRVPVVRIAPRKTCRGRLTHHDRLSSRR
jgi:hypothetical protein